MKYDYSKLLGKMKEKSITQEQAANIIGIKSATMTQKIHNKSEFKQTEIKKLCVALEISDLELCAYFFATAV